MFRTILTLILACFTMLMSCSNEPQTTDKEEKRTIEVSDVPELLDRHEALQHGKEWADIQSRYGKNRQKLLNDGTKQEPWLELAYVYMNEARITGEHGHYYPAALYSLDQILYNNPETPDLEFRTLAAKAAVQLSLHDFAKALETGKEAVAINPYNAQIYGVLVDAHVELGNYEKAVAMADKMVSIRPDLRSYARVSYLREIHGDIDGAIEAMEMAVKAGYPGMEETCWARLTLGNLYAEYGQPDKAKMNFEIILAEREDYPFAIAALADLEMEKGNYDKAEKMLDEACKIIPEVGFYEQLAHIYKETGREEEMKAIVDEIFVMLEDDVNSGHQMNLEYANIYADLIGDYDKALEYVQVEYDVRPENIDVNRMKASILVDKGEYAKAREYLVVAGKTNSQHPELLEMQKELKPLSSNM